MKFVCESCQTKYSIADDKVRRKILKIRCKTCGNVITVREPTDGLVAAEPAAPARTTGPRPVEGRAAPTAAVRQGAGGPPPPARGPTEWHLAVSGEQEGPFDLVALVQRLLAFRKDDDVHVWREDFDGWKPPADVPVIHRELQAARARGAAAKAPPPRSKTPPPPAGIANPPRARTVTPGTLGGTKPVPGAARSLAAAAGAVTRPGDKLRLPSPTASAPGNLSAAEAREMEDLGATPAPLPVPAPAKGGNGVAAAAPAGDGIDDIDFAEPSRVVKAGNLPVPARGNGIGEASLPGLSGTGTAAAFDPGPGTSGSGALMLARKTQVMKFAVGGLFLVVLLCVIIIVTLATKPQQTKTVIVERPRVATAEDVINAEKLARLEAERRFGASVHVEDGSAKPAGDLHSPPTRRAGAPPGRPSAHPPATVRPKSLTPPVAGSTPAQESLAKRFVDTGRPANRPTLPAASAPASAPPVPQESITRVIKGNQNAIKTCYEQALRRDKSLTRGRIDVTVAIGISGRVKRVDLRAPPEFRMVEPCIKESVKRWVFPAASDEYGTTFPLLLQGSE